MSKTKRPPRPLRLDDDVAQVIEAIAIKETEGNFSMAARKLLNEALAARGLWPREGAQSTTL